MKLKNLAFFGVMGAILSVASANATDSIPATDYLTTKGYVDTRDTAVKNAAVQDAVASAATGAFNASTNYTAGTIGAAIKGKQDTIDSTHKLSGTLISDGTVGTDQLSTAVNSALTAAGTALQAGDVDQTYDATSTDPISGKGVADAGFITNAALSGYATESYADGKAADAQAAAEATAAADATSKANAAQAAAEATAAADATAKANAKVSSAATISTTSTSTAPNEKAVSDALAAKLDSSTASSTYATQTALTDGLATKQNTIDADHKLSASLVEGALTSTDLTGYATETYVGTQIAGLDGSVSATDNKVVTGVTTTDGVVTAVASTLIANANVDANAAIAPSKLDLSKSDCPSGRTCILTYNASGNYAATPLTLANDTAGN